MLAVPAGERLPTGRSLSLALVPWLDGAARAGLSPRVLSSLTAAQRDLFGWLQHLDDLNDGQAQARSGAAGRARAEARLERLLPRGHRFWFDFARLSRAQERSVRWEEARRTRPLLRFGPPLLRRLGAKASLLRSPAFAVAALAGRPPLARALEEACDRVLTAAVLLDDLGDFEEDLARQQVNAVLCAGRIDARGDEQGFLLAASRGALSVCQAAVALLSPVARAFPGTALATGCADLQGQFARLGPRMQARCRARSLAALLGRL